MVFSAELNSTQVGQVSIEAGIPDKSCRDDTRPVVNQTLCGCSIVLRYAAAKPFVRFSLKIFVFPSVIMILGTP